MPRRYFISDLVPDPEEEGAYLPELALRLGPTERTFACEYPQQDTTTGAFLFDKCLVVIDRSDAESLAGPASRLPPEISLDLKLSSIHNPTKNDAILMLRAAGFPVTAQDADGWRVVIRQVGRRLNPNFDESKFYPPAV